MKKLLVSLLAVLLLLSACNNETDISVSTQSGQESDPVDDMSCIGKYPEINTPLFERDIQIELPANVFYSLEVRKDYHEVFADYIELRTEEHIDCYAWLENGELKFGLGVLRSIDSYETIKKSLIPATLGEMRALFSTRFSFAVRKKIAAIPLDDSLLDYVDELEYMLGVGEDCIEFTVSLGDYKFDIPFYNEEANELYELFNKKREEGEKAPIGSVSMYNGEEISVGISFAAAGTEDFGGISDCGHYTLRPDGYMFYYDSIVSSSSDYYKLDSAFYSEIYTRVVDLLYEKGIKFPFAQTNKLWCRALVGLGTNDRILLGDKAENILAYVESLSALAEPIAENATEGKDAKTAVYIEFYDCNMRFVKQFTVYCDDTAGLLGTTSERKYGILPKWSYYEIINLITDESYKVECNVFGTEWTDEKITVSGRDALELFDTLYNAYHSSREATAEENSEHRKQEMISGAVMSGYSNSRRNIVFTNAPIGYLDSRLTLPMFEIYQDEYGRFTPSSLMSYMPNAVFFPKGTYEKVMELISEYEELAKNQQELSELFALLDENEIRYPENAVFYDVTPEAVRESTDYRIYKEMTEFGSYIVADGKVSPVCFFFGGFGFHDAYPCDYNCDGVTDLLVVSSWGSGLHRTEISLFDVSTRKSERLFSSLELPEEYYSFALALDVIVNENSENRYLVQSIEISPISSKPPETITVGEIVFENNKAVFKPLYNEQ
ncbi:MAG: hypothetical protein E7595_04115 [Ruminococcaceae bacterium]|nr:hypothetical protein [Oscillospiraceae bacterium]